jgi:cell wall-associated NlpC family hydrolase
MQSPVLASPPLDLKGRIDAILSKARGTVSIACLDLLTGAAWDLEGDRPFPSGQLSALPVLLNAYDRAQHDDLDLEPLRPMLLRTVTDCQGDAITQLAERLAVPVPETMTARELRDRLAALGASHPLWDLLPWEGDRTKFPRRLPRLAMAYKAADRCEPLLAHAAGRLGGPEGVLLVVMTAGDAIANSLIGRIAQAVWNAQAQCRDDAQRAAEQLEACRARRLPDRRLGVLDLQVTWQDGSLRIAGETSLPRILLEEAFPEPLGVDLSGVEMLDAAPAMVVAPVLNLRREPRHGSELVSQAPLGTRLTVLRRPEGEWFRVQTPDGYVAWARSENLRLEPPAEEGLRTLPIVLAAQRLDGAGTVPLPAGSALRIRERGDAGWRAETPQGVSVWVPEGEAIAASDRPTCWRDPAGLGAQAVAIAARWLGVPYLWGGKSGWGLDCSGLTQLAYELLGMRLPRDADQQAKALPPVPGWDALQPGDLLFYPGHVALWAGAGAVIHASSPRGAVVREDLAQVSWLRERCTAMGRPVQPR